MFYFIDFTINRTIDSQMAEQIAPDKKTVVSSTTVFEEFQQVNCKSLLECENASPKTIRRSCGNYCSALSKCH